MYVTVACRNQRYSIVYFDHIATFRVLYHWTHVKGGAHLHWIFMHLQTMCEPHSEQKLSDSVLNTKQWLNIWHNSLQLLHRTVTYTTDNNYSLTRSIKNKQYISPPPPPPPHHPTTQVLILDQLTRQPGDNGPPPSTHAMTQAAHSSTDLGTFQPPLSWTSHSESPSSGEPDGDSSMALLRTVKAG